MPADQAPRRPLSLSVRITLFVAAAMTAVFVFFTLQVLRSIEHHFAEQDLGELRAVARSLEAALGDAPSIEDAALLDERLSRAVAGHHNVYFGVQDERGTPHYGTAPAGLLALARAAPASAALNEQSLRVWSVDGHTYRAAVLRMREADVLVAMLIDFHLHYLARLRQVLWSATLAVSLVSVLAAWLAVKWGHAPIRHISERMRSITSEQLHVRLEPAQVPSELAHLVASFNLMLDRLQRSFERLSHFSVDIAHELRTPVTNLTTQTEVALSKPRPADAYREILYSNLEELERMGKMIGDMLFLAQADHPQSKLELAEVDLADETRALFEYFEALAEERDVELRLEGEAPRVRGDRPMLRRAISNLVSNALRYVPRGQPLTVRLGQLQNAAQLSVENAGPPIAAEHLPKLFDRFYRVDPARQRNGEGAGLGLAIVKSIIEAHDGTVAVRSDGGFTRFMIRLPLAGHRPPAQTT